ncbi:MAG: pyruvate ferredoxin oxidoreductase [Patescibacteria group bacterium]|nr:pyruvate ferredoxin oxidoreductase [Patescibacteria group bacterium]
MKKLLEGSQAIAQVVNLCRPGVISAYPITPQTHIVEDLAKIAADGEASFEFVRTESEFAAASVILGASATGVRAYSATTSQGLLLMTEVIYNIAGMNLPVVLTCANRAVSAPINIWNDQQDAYSVRDAGWIMFFANDIQEAVDLHILAFKVAESVGLPVMVNMDGFYLTHTVGEVDIPDQKLVDKFLKKQSRDLGSFLDVKNPKTFGYLATPKEYQDMRMQLDAKIKKAKNQEIKKAMQEFEKVFGRKLSLTREYKLKDAKTVFVSTGSIFGTTREAVDLLRLKGKKVGICNLNLLRPFPDDEIVKKLKGTKKIIVLNRAISLGTEGILTTEIKKALYGKHKIEIQDEIIGLGGRDIRVEELVNLV